MSALGDEHRGTAPIHAQGRRAEARAGSQHRHRATPSNELSPYSNAVPGVQRGSSKRERLEIVDQRYLRKAHLSQGFLRYAPGQVGESSRAAGDRSGHSDCCGDWSLDAFGTFQKAV